MGWTIEITARADKAIGKLDKPIAIRIIRKLEDIAKLENPRSIGKPLTGRLAGLWRYRVGDYRIVCSIEDGKIAIVVVDVDHRREIYD